MALRRGFKSEAERIAKNVRSDLGIRAVHHIDPEVLAKLLGVEVRAGDELIPRDRFSRLEEVQPGSFSACTLSPSANRVVVVYNPLSSPSRRASDLAHELAHILLNHSLGRLDKLGDISFFTCDPVQEEEAAWLAGCLLLPRPLLLSEIRKGSGANEIAEKYGVSQRLAQYRLNVTGVLRQQRSTIRGSNR